MIVFVVLHYLAEDITEKCVDSIFNNVDGNKRVIIVDNYSPNDSYQRLVKYYIKNNSVDIIKSEYNGGFAYGNNIGYKYAKKNFNPEFIIVMNNDMEIHQKNFMGLILKSYNENKFAILGPDIYSVKYKYHQNPQSMKNFTINKLKKKRLLLLIKNKIKAIYWVRWKIFGRFRVEKGATYSDKPYKENIVENVPLHGSFYVFSKKFIDEKDACFDEGTFMYLESYILAFNAMLDKMKMIYDPRLKVIHYEDMATDRAVTDRYKKAVFSNRCLLQSTEYFINLMEDNL